MTRLTGPQRSALVHIEQQGCVPVRQVIGNALVRRKLAIETYTGKYELTKLGRLTINGDAVN